MELFYSFLVMIINYLHATQQSKNLRKFIEKILKLMNFFSADKFDNLKFDLITSIAMFYDLPDPLKFAKDIESLLAKDGIWHVEMSYMPNVK